jgi:hypothetical protein
MSKGEKELADLVDELSHYVDNMIEKKKLYIEAVKDVRDKAKELLDAKEFTKGSYKDEMKGMKLVYQNAKSIIEANKK